MTGVMLHLFFATAGWDALGGDVPVARSKGHCTQPRRHWVAQWAAGAHLVQWWING